ncbi:MAG: sigma-70 family RNA polymerase sigma factor [Gammaproteobacteria bacterium]|nr:sigma-70 family RNA polymerase sigma factor [Gammaproteobacteria bacterium]
MNRTSEHILDEWLVSAAQAGDAKAFSRLAQRWHPKLLAYANSQLQDEEGAKDATQETLLQVSQSLSRLQDSAAFPKWIYQILNRRCIDIIRHKQKRRKFEQHAGLNPLEAQSESLKQAGRNEQVNTLSDDNGITGALRQLEPKLSQVVRLFYIEGFSAKEMAEILAVPAGTVKSRLFSARQKLITLLGDADHE